MPQLPLDELTGVIARIRGLLLTEEKVDRAVHMLARAVKESLSGTAGAGVSLLDSRGRRLSSGFTDTVVKQADAAQYEIGHGPCLTAWAAEETVIVDDIATDGRWPEWAAAVSKLPVRSLVSVPLLAGNNWGNNVSVEGFKSGPDTDTNSRFNEISPGYFRTLGVPLMMDPRVEKFVGNTAADALLTREYRKPYVVPERV